MKKNQWQGFDMEEWQECLRTALYQAWQELMEEYDEVYAISLMASPDLWSFGIAANTKSYLLEQAGSEQSEDFFYYKYAEEEWGIADAAAEEFEDISEGVRTFLDEYGDRFLDQEEGCLTEEYQTFRNELFGTCLRTLMEVKEELEGSSKIAWDFYVKDFFEVEDMEVLYRMLNEDEKRVEEFCSILDYQV